MGSALGIGLALGGISALTSYAGQAQAASQQKAALNAQAEAQAAQAAELRRQASLAEQQGQVEKENIALQRTKLRREYGQEQSRNRSLLGAGNVDMSSGSALLTQLGNIDRFALDMGENKYEQELKAWETRENVRKLDYQARTADAQADYLGSSASRQRPSLLNSLIAGGSGFLSGYTMAGGRLWSGGAGASGGSRMYWDRALGQWSSVAPRH